MEMLDYILIVPGLLIAGGAIAIMFAINNKTDKNRLSAKAEPEKTEEKKKKIGTDRSDWWWSFFKPHFAVPVAWTILHLILFLTAPYYFKEIFTNQLKLLAAVEIIVLILNSVLNKDTKFEERFSRGIMTFVYSALIIVVIGTIWNRASIALEPKKPATTIATLRPQLKAPPRKMSGIIRIPAGKGPEETKVWVSRKEIVWLAANPGTKLFDAKSGRAIEIGSDGWTSPLVTKKGYLTFLKGPEPINVNYSIIN